jgi:hypothetical protein
MFDTLACNLGRIVNPDSACPVATAEDQTSGGLDTGAPQGGDALAGVSQPWYCCIR